MSERVTVSFADAMDYYDRQDARKAARDAALVERNRELEDKVRLLWVDLRAACATIEELLGVKP